ncbi:hypothetical protein niasHT_031709 [Heterodera trifolii]|uniref:Uncharacterized protein n=1 Tax=Heterodera trifolii TaxID=157864 RepID=A0ABD2IY33_9BILA
MSRTSPESPFMKWSHVGHMISSPFRAAHRNPNGDYEGYTDTETRPVSTRKQIMAEIACMFGGRIAERMFCKLSLVESGPMTRSKKARFDRVLAKARKIAEAVLWPNKKLIKKGREVGSRKTCPMDKPTPPPVAFGK